MRRTKLRLCRWSGRIHSRLFPISVASLPMSTNNRTMQHVTHPSRDTYKTVCLPNCMSYYRQNSWITISGTVDADNRGRRGNSSVTATRGDSDEIEVCTIDGGCYPHFTAPHCYLVAKIPSYHPYLLSAASRCGITPPQWSGRTPAYV